jgi:hypothetical protein
VINFIIVCEHIISAHDMTSCLTELEDVLIARYQHMFEALEHGLKLAPRRNWGEGESSKESLNERQGDEERMWHHVVVLIKRDRTWNEILTPAHTKRRELPCLGKRPQRCCRGCTNAVALSAHIINYIHIYLKE